MDGAKERRAPRVRFIAGRSGSQPANGWRETALHSDQLRPGEPPSSVASSHESFTGEQAGGNTRTGSLRRVGPARQIAAPVWKLQHARRWLGSARMTHAQTIRTQMLPLASRLRPGVRSSPSPKARLDAYTLRHGNCRRSHKLRATGTSIPWSHR